MGIISNPKLDVQNVAHAMTIEVFYQLEVLLKLIFVTCCSARKAL